MNHLRTLCLALFVFPFHACPSPVPEPAPSFEGNACREYAVEGGVGYGRVVPCSKLGKGR